MAKSSERYTKKLQIVSVLPEWDGKSVFEMADHFGVTVKYLKKLFNSFGSGYIRTANHIIHLIANLEDLMNSITWETTTAERRIIQLPKKPKTNISRSNRPVIQSKSFFSREANIPASSVTAKMVKEVNKAASHFSDKHEDELVRGVEGGLRPKGVKRG